MRVRGRPLLYTSYRADMALLNTRAKRVSVGLLLLLGLALPFLLQDSTLNLLAVGCVAAIGAIGLGLVTGYAGQVSLGHAFFFGIGAYTSAFISGETGLRTMGLGVPNLLVWLPAAGLVALLFGVIVEFFVRLFWSARGCARSARP
jgi:branched-chain amino acid transport system permease protein